MTAVPAPLIPADPTAASRSQLAEFRRYWADALGRPLADDAAVAALADEDIRAFWRAFLAWSGVRTAGEAEPVCDSDDVERARFFPNLRLNYAAELLRASPGDGDAPAVVAIAEDGRRVTLTRGALRDQVGRLTAALHALGVRAGDRVVAVARNGEEPIVAVLAAAALGAAWSSVAPDLGLEATVTRFETLEPTVLFTHTRHQQHGAKRDLLERTRQLRAALPSLRHVILLDAAGDDAPELDLPVHRLSALLVAHAPTPPDAWPLHPFNTPLFILFSSGTTGRPKCIVHGAGGTLLEHLKEHRLHGDMRAGDVMLFLTTCGWMMWNWQLSALACGSTIVVYDGSVSYPEADAVLRHVDAEGVTVFGTSAAYLQYCQDAGLTPRAGRALRALRAIQTTGSILYEHQFEWMAREFGPVPIQSISGGTDIVGCFVLGHPHRPVYSGDSQSVGLALAVRAWTERGPERTGTGDLVCVRPFPSRPLGLWADPDGTRFHAAYFAEHPAVWTHGDRLALRDDGGARILGRVDGTLNVRGVRIGPAEIYQIVLQLPEIVDAMAVEQRAPREPGGSRLVLLVVLAPDHELDRPLTLRIKKELSQRASANHVPAVVAAVSELPMTLNGKRSERAARDALNGDPVENRSALRRPEVLDELAQHPLLRVTG